MIMFIIDLVSKSFIKSLNCTLVDRSETFKLEVWFMLEENCKESVLQLTGPESLWRV
jgi:hypothetical protein